MTTSAPTQAEQDQIQQQYINLGTPNVSTALSVLWEKTADRLTTDELQWFTDFTDEAKREVVDLSSIVMGIGCLVASDKNAGNFQNRESVSDLLFNISHQLNTISGMIHIGNSAEDRLRNPGLYKMIDAVKGGEA